MRILILGGDGYLGWPTAMYFSNHGHEVAIVDNFLRRRMQRKLVEGNFDEALEQAVQLAKAQAADHLPGWCGPVARE